MKPRIFRRDLLARIARIGSAIGAFALVRFVPEASALHPGPTASGGVSVDTQDPLIRSLWDQARRTREWARFATAMLSGLPARHTAVAAVGGHLLSFTVRDQSPEAVEARKYASFEVLHELVFAFDGKGAVVGVSYMVPDDLTWTVRVTQLRSGHVEVVQLGDEARRVLAARRAESYEIRQRAVRRPAGATKAAKPLLTHCDCYPDRIYCGQMDCRDGYVDHGCALICNIGCAASGIPWWICIPSCEAACWVPPSCICLWVYCGACLVA